MKPFFYILITIFLSACTSGSKEAPQHTNALINESSPYLLQHAHNPVDWHPWGDHALQQAKEEEKLLLISIGYAACHWCHVMEEESFRDTAVANLMNEHYVSIKVDREERPDVDDVYMTACQVAGEGNCGWPLNAIALPDGRPIWVGTYFPKKQWMDILNYFIEIQKNQAEKINAFADRLTEEIHKNERLAPPATSSAYSQALIDEVAQTCLENIDFREGGLAGRIKFPMPLNFDFLLDYHYFTDKEKALEAVILTLNKMAKGGIYDHLAGGFARYSTDSKWKVPHFEKMLYDNAQLVSLYAHAYQVTKDSNYERIIRETLQFVGSEWSSPEGGFYSSLNADSEGEEGKYYVWKKEEIDALIADPVNKALLIDHFDIKPDGNWEEGKNVLSVKKSTAQLAKEHRLAEEEVVKRLEETKKLLLEARKKRVKPSLDDKVLTSWNALMIQGYLDAFRALGFDEYKKRAIEAARFLVENQLKDDGRLDRNFKDGKSSINAFLDDYANTIRAFLELYQVTFDPSWLDHSRKMTQYVLKHFKDPGNPLFFYASDLDPPLITRKKEINDNVIPASNSVMAHDLFRLGMIDYDTMLIERSRQMLLQLTHNIKNAPDPSFYANWSRFYLLQLHTPNEVVVIGDDFERKRDRLLRSFLPNSIFLGGKNEGQLPLLQNKLVEGKTMIYVCRNRVCKLPVEETNKAIEMME